MIFIEVKVYVYLLYLLCLHKLHVLQKYTYIIKGEICGEFAR